MLLIDKYAYFNALTNTHPVEKLTLSLSLLLFVQIVKDPFVSLITFIVMSVLIVIAAKIPVRYYVRLLLLPSFFLITGVMTILLTFTEGQTAILWSMKISNWRIFITQESLHQAGNLCATVMGSISCLYFLTLTTPLTSILDVLQKLKLPALFIELIALTYRFIFVFLDESAVIYRAQASRLGFHSVGQSIKSIGLLISMLFLKVFQRSSQLSIAMNSRCYQDEISYLEQSYQYSPTNWLMMTGIWLGMIVYIQFGGIL